MIQKTIYNDFQKVLKEYGSKGAILIKLPPTATPTAQIFNSYDENGIEITPPTDRVSDTNFEVLEIKYSVKKLTIKERTELSLSDGAFRFTFIYKADLKMKKGDLIEDYLERRFSIEYIDILGDMQDQKMLYQIIGVQD